MSDYRKMFPNLLHFPLKRSENRHVLIAHSLHVVHPQQGGKAHILHLQSYWTYWD